MGAVRPLGIVVVALVGGCGRKPLGADAGDRPDVAATVDAVADTADALPPVVDAGPDLIRDRDGLPVPGCPTPRSVVEPLGEPAARVKAFLFQDLGGPFDRKLALDSLARLRTEYVEATGRISLHAVDWPLEFHPNAARAAEAARAADAFGAFWAMRDLILEKQAEWVDLPGLEAGRQFESYAASLGLDETAFALEASRLRGTSFIDQSDAKACGVVGVPTIVFLVPKPLATEADLRASGAYVKSSGDAWIAVVAGAQEWLAFGRLLDAIRF